MHLEPPQGSMITISEEGLERVIRIHRKHEGVMKFIIGFFLLFWMGGWFLGLYKDFLTITSGKSDALFITHHVAGVVGGICAGYLLYALFRPYTPETIRLRSDSVHYDTGFPSFHLELDFDNPKGIWRPMLPKRTLLKLDKLILQTLRLRETDSGNLMTVDHNAERLDIGKTASEVEREWLYEVLTKTYT